jgi:PmbA protein
MNKTRSSPKAGEKAALDLLHKVLERARRAGAETADAVWYEGTALSASVRLGKPEGIERAEDSGLGLRVLIGKRQSFVATTDTQDSALDDTVARAVAMARAAPEDDYCGLADAEAHATAWPDLDLLDERPPPAEKELLDRAMAVEDAAMAVKGVVNSEGGEASFSRSLSALATSTGFAGAYGGTRHGISTSVVASNSEGMERDYEFASAHHLADLPDPASVGRKAGENAVKRLGPRKVASQAATVIYDPRVANSLVGHLAGAINGQAVARGTSFLKDRMGQAIFPAGTRIIDDPLRKRGLRSRPFDGEGLPGRELALIDDGRLTTWLLDTASGRQLKLPSTGHASRGPGSPPHPSASNLYLAPGRVTPEKMIAEVKSGIYVTDLIGFGVNGVTGDYSRGAAGFWIEDGVLAFPVSELTIAGNLLDMFRRLTAANDLVFKYGTDSPTVRVDGMTVAGT